MIQVNTLFNNASCSCDYCNKTILIKEVDIPLINVKLKLKKWNIENKLGLSYLMCPNCIRQNKYLQLK